MKATVLFVMTTALMVTPLSVQAGPIDIVGGTQDSARPNPWDAKGNAFRVDSAVTLLEQEFYLNFTGTGTFNYYVYESVTEFGSYSQIQMNSVTHTSVGEDWYSSGPVNVPLTLGDYYIIAISSSGDFTYFFNSGGSQAVSFGSQVHGFATGFHPLGATITSSSNDGAIYYQRLTIPEPASLVQFVSAAGLALLRRRR